MNGHIISMVRIITRYHRIEKMPIDKKGYVIEVIMTKKGDKFDRNKRVKVFDSKGVEIVR